MVADGYKDTEIGVIPAEWDVKQLDDVCSKIVGGGTPSKNNPDYWTNGTILWATPTEFTKNKSNYISSTILKITDEALQDSSAVLLQPNTVIMSSRATIGECKINIIPMTTNQGFISFECNPKLNNLFLLYTINQHKSRIIKVSSGSTFLEVSRTTMRNFKIPLPPLKEQEKIADILSTADDKIAAIAIQIEKAETLKKGLLQKLLSEGIGHSEFKDSELGRVPESWGVSKLKDIFKMKSGSTPYRKNLSYFDNGTIFWIKTLDLNNGYITNSQEKITEQALAETSCSLLPINSILIAMYGGYKQIGRTGVLSIEATTNQAITALFPNDETISNFINYTLIFYRYKWKQVATSSRKDPNITKKDIEDFIIPFPPLEEQKQIADIVSTADEKLEVLRAKKEKYETLKKGLMQKLLMGEVRVGCCTLTTPTT